MSALASLEQALAWLRSVAAAERAAVPLRLHMGAAEVQPSDQLGAPRMAGAFLNHLGSPFATQPIGREVPCPAHHPLRRYGDPLCLMCDDAGYWMTNTDIYARPLRAAVSSLSRARSALRPHHPSKVVTALLRDGCDPANAAGELGVRPDNPCFLSAVRALYDHFSVTAMGPTSRSVA